MVSACDNTEEVTVAEAGSVWWNAPMFIAHDYYADGGLTVSSFDVQTGLDSMNAVLSGNADFGVVASAPLVTAAARDKQVVILGSYMASDRLIGIATRNNKDLNEILAQNAANDTTEKPAIAYTKGTISEFYFRALLEDRGLPTDLDTKYNMVSVPPPGIIPAMLNEDVSAAVSFEPFSSLLQDRAQNQDNVLISISEEPNLYTVRSYIITTKSFYDANPDIVTRFVDAYRKACDFIIQNDEAVQSRMIDRFDFDTPGILRESWPHVDFAFVTSRNTIQETLVREAQLAHAAGIITGQQLTVDAFQAMLTHLETAR